MATKKTKKAAPAKKKPAKTTKTAKQAPKQALTWTQQVWGAVRLVPRGRVCAYVDVAAFLGHPLRARQVGNALGALDETNSKIVPWQRVVNARGFLSIRGQLLGKETQRALLQREGVDVGADFVVADFAGRRWSFPPPSL